MKHSLGLLLLSSLCLFANATVIVSHSGSANPTTESPAWAGSPSTTPPGIAVGGVVDNGVACWQIADNSTANWKTYSFAVAPAVLVDPAGWTLTAYVRVVSNARANNVSGEAINVALGVADGQRQLLIDLVGTNPNSANNGVWFWNTAGTETQVLQMNTASAFHTYQMIFNPAQADRIAIYVDGVSAGTVLKSSFFAYNGAGQPVGPGFGSAAFSAISTANWGYVAFESGQNIRVIPEPAFSLAGLCAAVFPMRRLRLLRT